MVASQTLIQMRSRISMGKARVRSTRFGDYGLDNNFSEGLQKEERTHVGTSGNA
jgi:hypothetical protein